MSQWMPTTKWWAATAVTAATVVLMFWTGGGIDSDDERTVLVGLILARVVAYITRNEPDNVVLEAGDTTVPVRRRR